MVGVYFVYRLRTWTLLAVLLGSMLALGSTAALADCPPIGGAQPVNCAPPTNAILDLGSGALFDTSIPHDTATLYYVDFMAAVDDTAITFAFRNDPWFLQFSDVSLIDLTTGGGNLLQNGDFSQVSGTPSLPVDWTYTNLDGAAFGGYVRNNCGVGSSSCWWDGAVQGYDALTQQVAMTAGDEYHLSFYVLDAGGPANWSAFSTNGDTTDSGGNGADILAYATGVPGENIGDGPLPSKVPEPSTWVMMLLGFASIGYLGYRRRPMLR
jgi:PEP-CTERM motif